MNELSNQKLIAENNLLKNRLTISQNQNNNLLEQISNFQNQNKFLQEQLQELQEQIAWFKKQIFGSRSEKHIDINNSQLLLPGFEDCYEKPDETSQNIKAHTRKKYIIDGKDKFSFPDDLPKERIILDLPEEEKISQTGESLIKIGEEITSKLAYKPGSYIIKEYIRPKYAAKDPEEGIKTEELPDSILPKSLVDESFLSFILTMKFANHMPLYRIREILFREDIKISKQLLSQWVVKIGLNLSILYDAMFKKVLESGRIFVDETPISLLIPGNKKVHKAYIWVYVGGTGNDPPYRIYDFCLNRQYDNAIEKLKNYKGIIHSDKYGAYEKIAKKEDIIWSPCWVHIRRKFIESESGDIKFRNKILRKIKYLFWFEKIAWTRSSKERLQIRKTKEEPIIDELIKIIKAKLIERRILPKSNLKKAMGYFCSLIPHLKNYLNYSEARLDNNVAERAVRPLAIGRKNWLFVGSENGGKAAAVILSLIQTCRNLNINPQEYLEDIMRRIMSHPANRIHELLPDKWLKTQKNH